MQINRNQYFQVIGLLSLARHHKKFCDECEEALRRIVEPDAKEYSGHSGDAIWSEYEADELLQRCKITVVEEAADV